MVFDYREPYGLHSTQFLHSATIDCSSHPRPSGMMHHQRLQGSHPQFQPHPLSSTQSLDLLDEVMLRQIEKESIRQEIIMFEIIRRRALEAEVRYEMMVERAMALQRGRIGLDVPMRFPLAETGAEGMFLDERIISPPPPRYALNNWREGGESEDTPFLRAPIDERMARVSVADPVLEASSEKSKMILQAKPIINITGAKRASESQSYSNLRKKVKEEWSCALCHVSVDDEFTLNMHLAGKKHKRKEAALSAQIATKNNSIKAAFNARKAGKNSWSWIPLSTTNIVADSMKDSETANPAINSEVKLTSESLLLGKIGDASSAGDGLPPLDVQETNGDIDVIVVDVAKLQLSTNKVAECIKDSESSNPATDNEVKLTCESLPYGNDGDANNFKKKKKKKNNEPNSIFWCEICQVSVPHIQEGMDAHQQGKKHKRRAKLGDGTSAVSPSDEKAKPEEQDGMNVKKAEEEKMTSSQILQILAVPPKS